MRTITVALGSFIVGAVFMSAIGNQTSTFRQSVFAQVSMPNPPTPTPLPLNKWVPVVPPLTVANEIGGNMISGQSIDLDGMMVYNDVFNNITIRYGGGAYVLRNTAFSGNVNLNFVGAAGNTYALLNLLGLIGCPAKAPAPDVNPNKPIIRSASLTTPVKGTFTAPFMGAK